MLHRQTDRTKPKPRLRHRPANTPRPPCACRPSPPSPLQYAKRSPCADRLRPPRQSDFAAPNRPGGVPLHDKLTSEPSQQSKSHEPAAIPTDQLKPNQRPTDTSQQNYAQASKQESTSSAEMPTVRHEPPGLGRRHLPLWEPEPLDDPFFARAGPRASRTNEASRKERRLRPPN